MSRDLMRAAGPMAWIGLFQPVICRDHLKANVVRQIRAPFLIPFCRRVEQVLHSRGECRLALQYRPHLFHAGCDFLLKMVGEQCFLDGEVLIERRFGDIGCGGDLLHRHVLVSMRFEQLEGGTSQVIGRHLAFALAPTSRRRQRLARHGLRF